VPHLWTNLFDTLPLLCISTVLYFFKCCTSRTFLRDFHGFGVGEKEDFKVPEFSHFSFLPFFLSSFLSSFLLAQLFSLYSRMNFKSSPVLNDMLLLLLVVVLLCGCSCAVVMAQQSSPFSVGRGVFQYREVISL
jgi:hypothetical protein